MPSIFRRFSEIRYSSNRLNVLAGLVLLAVLSIGDFYFGSFAAIDLRVYRAGAYEFIYGNGNIYKVAGPFGLPFTYPPIAAFLFAPLAIIPTQLAIFASVAMSVLCLFAVVSIVMRNESLVGQRQIMPAALMVTALFLAIGPANETLHFGQINIFLMFLVCLDGFLMHKGYKYSGLLIGLAAGIKLTPAIFILWLVAIRKWRTAAMAVIGVLLTMVIGFALMPDESFKYWTEMIFDAGRVGGIEFVGNQSLNGMIWRVFGDGGAKSLWVALSSLVVGLGLFTSAKLFRQGLWLHSLLAVALVGLLISPISWDHHWVWVVPIVIALGSFVWKFRLTRRATCAAAALINICWLVVFASRAIWQIPHRDGKEFSLNGWQQIIGSSYVLLGVFTLVWFGFVALRET